MPVHGNSRWLSLLGAIGEEKDMDDYLENYIIAESKEQYRLIRFWSFWLSHGLLAAINFDDKTVADWGIVE